MAEDSFDGLIAWNYKYRNQKSWLRWAVFDKHQVLTPQQALGIIGWFPYQGGPNHTFAHEPVVRESNSRILIIQRGGAA